MVGPVMRAMMVHSSAHEEPHDGAMLGEIPLGETPLGADVVWDALDSGFTLPPPAVDLFRFEDYQEGAILPLAEAGVLPQDLQDDLIDIESTALDLDQSSRVSDDVTITTNGLTPVASSVASVNHSCLDEFGRSAPRSMGLVPFPEDGHWGELRESLVIWGLKVRRELRTLDYLLQHWAVLAGILTGAKSENPAVVSNHRHHRLHMQAPVECAHRVGGRRVALRSSRRAGAVGPRGAAPATRRSSQQAACSVRHNSARVNREVFYEALETRRQQRSRWVL